jgi:VCBS repeat protein/ASPM-SPD-2-Hydin domain-containing protein
MQVKTVKKVSAASFRLATVSRRAVQAALILVVLASVVPAQLMAQNSIPLVNQPLLPTAVAPGGAAFTLTVNGTGFASGAVVNWNGSPRATTFVSASQVTAAILSTDIATAQTASVTVTNPAPGGGTSIPTPFEVTKSTTGAFVARNDIPANASAMAVAVGDFRRVGKQDLAVANSSNSIDVLLGNGDGTFQTAVNYPLVSGFPIAIVAADVNGDGKLDLAVLLNHTKNVIILTGNGDGTFTVGQQFATGNNPSALAVADVNLDGKQDLLVTNFQDNTVSVLLGNGDGTFQPKVDYATGVKPDGVAVGDFNGDGLPDLAVANNSDGTVSILIGAGSGTFPTHVDYPTAGLPTWVVAADFNGDGKLDLALSAAAGLISILKGNGDGTFGTHTDYKVNPNPQMVVAADFNGDGKLDLADVNFSDNSVSLLLGLGDGTFKAEAVFPTNTNPGWLALGDFNNDGRIDIAVATSAGELSILDQTLLLVSPTVLNFPTQEGGFASAPMTVTLRNTSTAAIGFSNVAITGANASEYSQTNTCGSSLAVGKTCTYSIVFTPMDLGTRTAQIIITETNGSSVGISLSGVAVIRIEIEPNPHKFPTTLLGTSSAPFVATVKNLANLTVNYTSLGLTGLDTEDYVLSDDTCAATTLAPLASCTIHVTFTPTTVGGRTAALTIFGHFSPGNGQQAILLSGLATGVSVKPTTLTFAAQTVGTTSAAKVVTVKNAGTAALAVSVTLQGGDPKDFAQTNNCNGSIPAGSSCTVNVTFTPQATGTRTSGLYIGDLDPTGPQIVTLTGTGQ